MREWIDLIGEAKDYEHPHLRGEPEWFSWMWGTFLFNVDLARKMIASGEVNARRVQMPVKNCYALLGLEPSEYGSENFADDRTSINMMSAIQSRETMKGMPDDKLNEPALIVMWNSTDAMKRAGLKLSKEGQKEHSKPSPVLIDGNHRLGRLYLEGAETATAYLIPYEEALKFCFDRFRHPMLKR